MPEKRCWLGIRHQWTNHLSPSRGEYRATRVEYNKQRLPWLQSEKLVTAAIFEQGHTLELFDTADPGAVSGLYSFWKSDRYIFTLNALAEFTRWPTTEALYFGFTGIDLPTNFRAVFDADGFVRKLKRYGLTGWYVIERGSSAGVSLVRELADVRDGSHRAVEVSCEGVAVYRYDLLRGSSMHEGDMIMHFQAMQLDMPRLRRFFSLESAISIRQAVRHYHLVMYELAVDYGLPF